MELPLINPQLAKPGSIAKVTGLATRDPKAFHLEPKYDGFRLLGNVNGDKSVLYTRTHHTQEGKLDHLIEGLREVFPDGTIVDGEVVALTRDSDGRVSNNFEHVQAVMNSLPARAVALQQDLFPLEYYIFDMLWYKGVDVSQEPLAHRLTRLHDYLKKASVLSSIAPHLLHRVPTLSVSEENYQKLLDAGYEGGIIKDRAGRYCQGKRGYGWLKLKYTATADVIITGFDPSPGGQYKDLFGAVRFGQLRRQGDLTSLEERGACSGMDVATRVWMWENRDALIGTVIEVSHMGGIANLSTTVKFRHPQFKRFRTDKSAEDCIWTNDG